MLRKSDIFGTLLSGLVLTALFLVSCSKDEEPETEPACYTVELLTGMNDYQYGGELTRALPLGYSEFNPGDTDPGKIGMFMTQQPTIGTEYAYTSILGTYTWSTTEHKWTSTVSVKYDKNSVTNSTFYAYGFMPADGSIGATIKSSDFAGGAVMTLTNVPPVSAQDLCIVTGVKTGDTIPDVTPRQYPPIADAGVVEGEYAYVADTLSNAIYLLLRHIYSKYSLRMKVDSSYNTLRTIKVTDMKLSATAPSMNVEVTYSHGSSPVVSMTALSGTATLQSDVLSTETTLTTTTTDLASFYCADLLNSIVLTTTFDVYDKAGNKLRSNCNTTNTVKVQYLEAGKHYTITATIKPTYLYQLSETDLDQPTIEI